jgi:hypothetical protein
MTMANLTLALVFLFLLVALFIAIFNFKYWKRRATCSEGVLLVFYCYPPIGEKDNIQAVTVRLFPGTPAEAMDSAYSFLDENHYKYINTASRVRLFCRGNKEMAKIFFLHSGIVRETMP